MIVPQPAAVLRPDLDLDRPAGHRTAGAAAHRGCLAPYLQRGVKVVGLEPSCTAVFRSDARELMPGDRDVQRLREQTVTLAELLRHHTDGWQPPHVGGQAIAQTHCHQHAIMGYDADQALPARPPASTWTCWTPAAAGWPATSASRPATTTCPWPAVIGRCFPPSATRAPDALVLADGFSCRIQIEQGDTGRTPVHLAEVLAAGVRGQPVRPVPARAAERRRLRPPRRDRRRQHRGRPRCGQAGRRSAD